MFKIPASTSCSVFTYADDFDLNTFKQEVDHRAVSPVVDMECDRLKRKAFGFVNLRNYLDDSYKVEAIGKYYVVCYAQCSRSLSSKAVEFAVNKTRQENGGTVSKVEKDAIKCELLREAPLQVKVFPVVVDPEFRRVYLFSTSNIVRDSFVSDFGFATGMQLYEESFTTYLVDTDNVAFLDGDANITGSFFTWLWYSAEANSYKEYKPEGNDSSYLFIPGARIRVSNSAGDSCRVSGDIREARNGIFNGKVVEDFSFTLNVSDGTSYEATVYDYDRITRTRVQMGLPSDDTTTEMLEESNLYLAIGQIDAIREALLTAFKEYLETLKTRGRKDVALEIFNWSKGDVCIKAFEEV